MRNLILVQALINSIEDATLETKYHSEFDYPSDNRLWIKTYCKQQAIAYMQVFDKMKDTAWYFTSNTELEVIDLSNE